MEGHKDYITVLSEKQPTIRDIPNCLLKSRQIDRTTDSLGNMKLNLEQTTFRRCQGTSVLDKSSAGHLGAP